MSEGFNATVYMSEVLSREAINMSKDLASRCVSVLAKEYNFDADEANRLLGLGMIKVERNKGKNKKSEKVSVKKAAFPLPYNGEFNDLCCYALRQNNGLYTQCTSIRKGEYCKSCASLMQKTGAEVPEYGTIQQRMAVDIFNYTDPKGRKPIGFTKVMKKYKISKEQVIEEAEKLGITINPNHFVVAEPEGAKRGRPKAEKEPKAKGVKGRPKKEKKVLTVEGEGDEDDLFAALVANSLTLEDVVKSPEADGKSPEADGKTPESDGKSPESDGKSTPSVGKKSSKSEEEREAERLIKLQEKESKRIAAEVAKKEKEEKLAIEKAEKAKEREAERLAREEKKKAEELAKLQEKEAKKAEKAKEREAKEQKKSSKQVPVQPEAVCKDEEEPDVVKKVEFDGKKYLKSKKTGIIYDYNEYVQNGEQVVVGKWNDTANKIVFTASAEEEEQEDDYE